MEMTYCCPECVNRTGSEDTGYHLSYNTDKQVWICYRCGYKGHGELPSLDGAESKKVNKNYERRSKGRPLYPIIDSKSMLVRKAVKYLTSHHLDAKQVAYDYGLMLDGQSLVFPVMRDGNMIYHQKRDLYDKSFCNPSVTKPLFWNRQSGGKVCAVVESFCNAVRLERWLPACCVFGKFVSDEQATEVVQHYKHVIVCLDPGELHHAYAMSRKLKAYGATRTRVAVLPLPDGWDVCDMDDTHLNREVRKWLASIRKRMS